ncbi:MAG: hypothetical protein Q4C87_05175 [Actinomycetaceae bacterium]|nr:hypothetical protein [Actinomycetaceae bacterium]
MTRKWLFPLILVPIVFNVPVAFANDCDGSGCEDSANLSTTSDGDTVKLSASREVVVPGSSGVVESGPPVSEVAPEVEAPVVDSSGEGSPFSAENLTTPSSVTPDCEALDSPIAQGACLGSQFALLASRGGGSEEFVSATPRERVDLRQAVTNVPTRRIVSHASGFAGVKGAGLVVEPYRHKVTKVPVVVHASQPRQVKEVELFGRKIAVTFVGTSFVFDFNDGSEPLVSATPGAPYPSMELQHIYRKGSPAQTVTLTTTWEVTLTNPWTGQTSTTKDALVTVETSDPFRVYSIHTYLTDTAEEEAGH